MKFNGIDFFPFPSRNSTALQLLEAKFKLKGVAIYVKLLQKIFSEEGYFYKVSDDIILLLKQEFNLASADNIIQDLINECIARGIFDKFMYEKYNILTSDDIQREYLNAVRKRKKLELNKEFLLPFALNFIKKAEETQKTAEETQKTAEDLEKGKERKENKKETTQVTEGYINSLVSKNTDTSSLIDYFKNETNKYTADVTSIPIGVDMQKLTEKVKNSSFLMSANNMTLKQCLKCYDKIINGVYDDDKPKVSNKPELVFKRNYSTKDLNSFFTNIDDIKFD